MNARSVRYYLGHILRWEAVLMLPSLFVSLYDGEWAAVKAFLITMALLLVVSTCLLYIRQQGSHSLQAREGMLTVGLSWVLLSLFGALPFTLCGDIPHYIDAVFESVSGFTTTGASILSDVEALHRGMLFWRSFTHWVGGMGVLVFVMAIIPLSKGNGDSLHLLRAESPGPSVGKVTPTMSKNSRVLYAIYVGMTLVTILLLLLDGMPLFDSLCNAFGAAGTGGFSIKNNGMNGYSALSQSIIAVAMLLFGVNFSIYYLLLTREAKRAFKDEELRWYLAIVLLAVGAIVINVKGMFPSFWAAVHHVFFTVSSIITTTGYSTVDFNLWPEFSRWILLLLMILGACAGSTGGGTKVSRLIMLFKSLKNEVASMMRPRSVHMVRINGKLVEESTIKGVYVFYLTYLFIALVSLLFVSTDNFDGMTTFSSVIACLGNIGPGLNLVGPTGNFGAYSDLSKIVLSLDMLFGRLEIFPLLLLFSPAAWSRRG